MMNGDFLGVPFTALQGDDDMVVALNVPGQESAFLLLAVD